MRKLVTEMPTYRGQGEFTLVMRYKSDRTSDMLTVRIGQLTVWELTPH